MLNKFRAHHKKFIMWGLASIIIPSFVLWGGLSYFKGRQSETFVRIGNRALTFENFNYYILMARNLSLAGFDTLSLPKDTQDRKLIVNTLVNKGLEYLLLLWKADKDKITVSDQEVAQAISSTLFDGKFNEARYQRILKYGLKLEPRVFEEHVRNLLKINKLLEKYVKVDVKEQEVKDAYIRDTQKAKISYIFIAYEKLKESIVVLPEEVEDFYRKNELSFKEEPKVKIQYIVVNYDNPAMDRILQEARKVKKLDDLAQRFDLEIKATDFIGMKDPVEGIGWQETINNLAFSLKKATISQPIEIEKGYIIIEKKEEKQAFIPALEDIREKVQEKAKEEKTKEAAKTLAENLLRQVNEQATKEVEVFAGQNKLDSKVTDYFKFHDYIEGVGLEEEVNKVVFSLKKDEIYQEPLMLAKGAYIIQLKELTSFDDKDFEAKKETYAATLKQQKTFMEKMKFQFTIGQESKMLVYANLQQQ